MASPQGVRKWFEPLEGGPWLTDCSVTGSCLRLSFWGFVVAFGLGMIITPFMKGGGSNGAKNLMLLVLFLFAASAMCFLVSLAGLVNRQLMQFCPDCLRSMTRGAHVCPYCGFRETPREEYR